MRVIAGQFRGRTLTAPPGCTTRPITDRIKETLFNILGHRHGTPGGLPALDVLDVFAGSGSLGIEALSRGARACVFVERDRRALRVLRENLEHVGVRASTRIVAENAWTMRPPENPGGFGLVFVDPPYRDSAEALRAADLLSRLAPSLAAEGLIVFRQETSAPPLGELPTLQIVDEREYGRMRIVLLMRRSPGRREGEASAEPHPENEAPAEPHPEVGAPAEPFRRPNGV